MSSAREEILKRPRQTRPIEAFGKTYALLVLSGRERNQIAKWSRECAEAKDFTGYREKCVILLLADESGARVFNDSDLEIVSGLDGIDLDKIHSEGLKFNRLIGDENEEAKKA